MEPIRPVEPEFAYDADAVRPFLGRPRARPNLYFRGRAAFPNTLRAEDRNYYYHATTLGNLPGILEQGLDPGRGGRGGAGALIAAPVNQRAAERFARRDAGFVYLSDNAEIAARYAFQYDDQADGYGEPPAVGRGNIQRSAVILRVRRDSLDQSLIERDSAEVRGAVRTREKLTSDNLELLTEAGWVPLRNRVLRQEIYNNVNDALGREGMRNIMPEDENNIREREGQEEIQEEVEEAEKETEEAVEEETREAGAPRPYKQESSLDELSDEENPGRKRRMTPPSFQSNMNPMDKSTYL